jgi:hypothetical protein
MQATPRTTQRDRRLLRTYGITTEHYNELLAKQGGVCAVCGGTAKTRALHVDHEHVKGYKAMLPRDKRRYIRGLLCYQCNCFLLPRGINVERAKAILSYLEAYESNGRNRTRTNGRSHQAV